NLDASERVAHLHSAPDATASADVLSLAGSVEGFTGMTMTAKGGHRLLTGRAHVTDRLAFDDTTLDIHRHVLSFFQGNRFLLRDLVGHVAATIPRGASVLDLYAGGGLFSVAAAHLRQARVTAVEGDRAAAEDLIVNAASAAGAVSALHQPVE